MTSATKAIGDKADDADANGAAGEALIVHCRTARRCLHFAGSHALSLARSLARFAIYFSPRSSSCIVALGRAAAT